MIGRHELSERVAQCIGTVWNGIYTRFSSDRRGYLPFAVIGVLLLVTTVGVVGYVQTSDDQTVDNDVDRAMGQTDAAIQTALRDAAKRATERAAAQPLTNASATPYGAVLDSEAPFVDYLRALIYLETRQSLLRSGQSVGDIETNVSLPPIEDTESFRAAIERVELSAGTDTPNLEAGLLRVQVSEIETIAHSPERVYEDRTETVEVAITTPIMQLHERTEAFQERLDAPVTQSGFSQRFNARIYALGWARGYAQYEGMPITEVIANRHVEPSANDAIYRTQRDVFGAADPNLNNAVRQGWLCMAAQDAQALYEGYRQSTAPNVANGFCERSNWLPGDEMSGDLPETPTLSGLLGDQPGTTANQTIGVNQTASVPLRQLVTADGVHSFANATDRIFTVQTDISTTYDRGKFDKEVECEFGARKEQRTNEGTTVTVRDVSMPESGAAYYQFSGQIDISVKLEKECWDSWDRKETTNKTLHSSFSVAIETLLEEGEVSPDANIDSINPGVGIEYKYEPGPNATQSPDGIEQPPVPAPVDGKFSNYDGIEGQIATEIVGGTTAGHFEYWAEQFVENATSPQEVSLPESKTVTLNHTRLLDFPLERTQTADVAALQDEIAEITHTFERRDLVYKPDAGDVGPYGELAAKVSDLKESYLERTQKYVNVGQKAVYEARFSYFERLETELRQLDTAHTESMSHLDDELQDADTGIASAVQHLRQGMTAAKPEAVPLESSTLTSDITYEISGSPTYLVGKSVTKSELPQVRSGVEFAPLAMKTENHLRMPYQSVVDGLLDNVLSLIGWGDPDAVLSFRIAGDALRAGELANETARHTASAYANQGALRHLTALLRDETQAEISLFEHRAATEVAKTLYPDDVIIYRKGRISCDPSVAQTSTSSCNNEALTVPEDCGGDWVCKIRPWTTGHNATDKIETAIAEALESYNTTAQRALAIGDGNATDRIVRGVVDTLGAPEVRPEYAQNLTDRQWTAVIASATRPAVVTAAGNASVTLSDTETVERLDNQTRMALENVSDDVLTDRIEAFPDEQFEINDSNYGRWVNGTDTPLRVPAGVPLLPVPGYWFATMNLWDIEVIGEYARFEVRANMGTPDTTTATTYVREDSNVTLELAGEQRQIGSVEPIEFTGRSILVVVVPPGGIGVGDRDDDDPECSPTWPLAGEIADEPHCGPPDEDECTHPVGSGDCHGV